MLINQWVHLQITSNNFEVPGTWSINFKGGAFLPQLLVKERKLIATPTFLWLQRGYGAIGSMGTYVQTTFKMGLNFNIKSSFFAED